MTSKTADVNTPTHNNDETMLMMFPNSTAALMATRFKNMKDEDFVFPSKKKPTADEGAVIRGQELLSRLKPTEMTQNGNGTPSIVEGSQLLFNKDIVLESLLSRMTDADFTYPTKKNCDPNQGRIVRALEASNAKNGKEKTEKSESYLPTTHVSFHKETVVDVSQTNPLFQIPVDCSREWHLPAQPMPYHKDFHEKMAEFLENNAPANKADIENAVAALAKLDVKETKNKTKKNFKKSGRKSQPIFVDKPKIVENEQPIDNGNTYYKNMDVPAQFLVKPPRGKSTEKESDEKSGLPKPDIFDRPTVWNSGPAYPVQWLTEKNFKNEAKGKGCNETDKEYYKRRNLIERNQYYFNAGTRAGDSDNRSHSNNRDTSTKYKGERQNSKGTERHNHYSKGLRDNYKEHGSPSSVGSPSSSSNYYQNERHNGGQSSSSGYRPYNNRANQGH